jgi:hypothetical protein
MTSADDDGMAPSYFRAEGIQRYHPRVIDRLFRIAAVAAVAAAAFHCAAMVSPSIASLEYEPTYPVWRHVLFIGIDSSLAVLFVRRPRWLVWAYALLTVQVLHSHGLGAWELWVTEHRIDWISVAVSIAAPAILVLLVVDRRRTPVP